MKQTYVYILKGVMFYIYFALIISGILLFALSVQVFKPFDLLDWIVVFNLTLLVVAIIVVLTWRFVILTEKIT